MKVKIYIETDLRGLAAKEGHYAAVVEYIKASGEAVTREVVGMEKQTTYYRMVLIAVIKALQMIKPCEVEIHTSCSFVINLAKQGRPEAWEQDEWKNSAGKEVKNKELWQQYLEEEKRHIKIDLRFSKHHAYRHKLNELIEWSKKKLQETA